MEKSKASALNQAQAGNDSGYSCTSTQSKYSFKSCHIQSASSGDSCIEERMSTKLKTADNRKTISSLHSKSWEKQNEIFLRNVSSLETSTNEESNTKSSKSEQINLTTFEPQMEKLYNNDKSKQPTTAFTIESDETHNLNKTTIENYDKNNASFLQQNKMYDDEPYCNYVRTKNSSSNYSYNFTISNTASNKELNEQNMQSTDIFEFDEFPEDSFSAIVSMNDGTVINASSSIRKSMGFPKDMWKGRPFIDFIHPKDSMAFINFVTSVLKDPCVISKQDDFSTVAFLQSKNNDGFYCNMRKYKCLSTGYSMAPKKYHYQVCKLTITFKDVQHMSTCSVKTIKVLQPQLLLIIKAQLIHPAYTYSKEKIENPLTFITKHNALFEWCYVDHLIISYLGYLPRNIMGTSIFNFYNKDDLTAIKEIHQNMIKSKSVPYEGKPYWFKCQNGDFALVQSEWSNFINPWSGQVEFVIGKHKVIQGPNNPNVTTPIDNITYELNVMENKKKPESNEDLNNVLNKNMNEDTEILHQNNQKIDINSNVKQQISKKCNDLALFMNCLVDGINPSGYVSPKVEVQPEMCDNFSDHNSVMLGKISPHHNYERKSSSGTSPSYTQLNYNDNIQRFFKSNVKPNSPETMKTEIYATEITTEEITPVDIDPDTIKEDLFPLFQIVTSNSSINSNQMSPSYCSEQNLNHNLQPLTQKMLLRHTKKMEDDLIKQHKNNTKKLKCSEKQHLSDKFLDNPDLTHGIKRCISSSCGNKSHKLTKRKHIVNSYNLIDAITETQEDEHISSTIPVVSVSKICPPCQITRDSQTISDVPRPPTLPNQVHLYNVPYSNNVMPVNHNEYENACILMDLYKQNQESFSIQLQPLPVPLYAAIPVNNHVPQNSQIVQPCLHYHKQLLLPQPSQNIECSNQMEQNHSLIPISNRFHQVNQEEFITSSDSECKRDIGSLKSSMVYEDSSFYSLSLRDKTDSSDKEEYSWVHQFIKKQPFWMEDVVLTPDLIYRYQIECKDLDEILLKDMNTLNTLSQPLLVNEQLQQLYTKLYEDSKASYFQDGTSSSSGGDDCLISIGKHKNRTTDFFRVAMVHEENAPFPPSTSPLLHSI